MTWGEYVVFVVKEDGIVRVRQDQWEARTPESRELFITGIPACWKETFKNSDSDQDPDE